MAISASRKTSMVFLFFVFLVGILSAFAPAFLSAREVRQFCEALPLGLPLAEVQARVAAKDYVLSKYQDGTLIVEHQRTLGRVECELRFDEKGQLASKARP